MLKTGTMPTTEREPGDEIVLFEFLVSSTGEVSNIKPLEGKDSKSLSQLSKSPSSWTFSPASSGTIPATGQVLFIKGEDYFRYQCPKPSAIPAVFIQSKRNLSISRTALGRS
jgi:hypothetical protein